MQRKYEKGFLVLLIFLAACVTTPVSQKSALILVPFWQEIALGRQAYTEVLEKEKESEDKETARLIERMGKRIAEVSDMPDLDWEFRLIESKAQNAFALPGGKVAIYTGILPVAQNEAGLAAVMSHEIAHVVARHGAQRISNQLVLTGLATVASIRLSDNKNRSLIMAALGLGLQFGVALPFSRSNETEADQIGLIYMARAGYEPNEALRFWSRMAGDKNDQEIPELLSTHPTSDTRIAKLAEYLPRARSNYNLAKVKYGLGGNLRHSQLAETQRLAREWMGSDATWTTEWTNSDGSKSKTQATFYSRTRSDGRVGHYGWNNGRFIGTIMNGARFEGKWVQDKSEQRCSRSVNGSHYYGRPWFEKRGGGKFKGGWSFCDANPNLGWRGWR